MKKYIIDNNDELVLILFIKICFYEIRWYQYYKIFFLNFHDQLENS